MRNPSFILKAALFATGLSGIVAEYVLATMATYFQGDSTVQWTMVLSIMLFSMGLGSRLSQYFSKNLLVYFIIAELLLSILVGWSALLVYTGTAYLEWGGALIYGLSIAIGMLIGLEIPLVTRINSLYQDLRYNISAVMENDYYGSLLGGVFFAFIGLPILGLTYTPFLLAGINFIVALAVGWQWQHHVQGGWRKSLIGGTVLTLVVLVAGVALAQPIIIFGEQARYTDKVVYEQQSRYQKIVLTQFKDDYWLYLNGNLQFATADEYLYHEPLVHPLMLMVPHAQKVLVLGGGDGCAVRELLKYPQIDSITLVDLDPAVTQLAQNYEPLLKVNQQSLLSPKVQVMHTDAFYFLDTRAGYYDAIIIDLPDPKGIDLNRLYSKEFYTLVRKHLRPRGAMVTQAGSPYFASRAFWCIEKTMRSAGMNTLPMHNQVITMGQWGWIMGMAPPAPATRELKSILHRQPLPKQVPLRWLTQEALQGLTAFGKPMADTTQTKVNTIQDPVLYKYYLNGNWDWY